MLRAIYKVICSMKIFGHPWIESETFYPITSIGDIKKTPTNSILELQNLSSSLSLAYYCRDNKLSYVLNINSLKEAMFANLLEATYLLTTPSIAKELMPIAQHYLFDTQVIAKIDDESEIEVMARFGVDAVSF